MEKKRQHMLNICMLNVNKCITQKVKAQTFQNVIYNKIVNKNKKKLEIAIRVHEA